MINSLQAGLPAPSNCGGVTGVFTGEVAGSEIPLEH
jgi:hypothetical protein